MSLRRSAPAAIALLLVVAGCGLGNDEEKGDATPSTDPTPSVQATTGGVGDGDDETTPWGTALGYGEAARFEWSPKADLDGTVEVRVDAVERAKIQAFSGFKLDEAMRASTPYYARVSVTNLGETDLGGVELPLFLDNGTDVLYPPANITASFKPCPNRVLPESFGAGESAQLCLVFLAGEGTTLRAVALQTAESTDQIEWTGPLSKPGESGKKGKQDGKKGSKKGKKSGGGKKSGPTKSDSPDDGQNGQPGQDERGD